MSDSYMKSEEEFEEEFEEKEEYFDDSEPDSYTRFTSPEEEKAIRESMFKESFCSFCKRKRHSVNLKELEEEEQYLKKKKEEGKEKDVMPTVEKWWNDTLQRFDDKLEILWNKQIERYVLVRWNVAGGCDLVMIIQDNNNNYIRPTPNLIMYGDEEIGVVGLKDRDTWSSKFRKPSEYINKWEIKREIEKDKKKRDLKEEVRDCAKDYYRTSAVTPRAFVKNNPLSKE